VSKTFSERIRFLRATRGLLQRQVANQLDIDTPMLSKIERGERKAKKEQVFKFANVLKVNVDDLLSLWLADQVYEIVKNEKLGHKALKIVEQQINSKD